MIKVPKAADLVKSAMAEIEKQVTKKAMDAAARHGGVTVRVIKKSDGSIRTIEFQGSEAAVEAAKAAIAN